MRRLPTLPPGVSPEEVGAQSLPVSRQLFTEPEPEPQREQLTELELDAEQRR